MKVLVLDDDVTRLEAFKRNIPKKYEVVCVSRQIDAIGYLATDNYYAVFLDHDLPDTNVATGLNVAFFIKLAGDKYKDLKVIIHSRNLYGGTAMHIILPNAKVWPGIWDFPVDLENILK